MWHKLVHERCAIFSLHLKTYTGIQTPNNSTVFQHATLVRILYTLYKIITRAFERLEKSLLLHRSVMTKTTHVQDEFGKDDIFLTTVFSLKQSSLRKYRPVIDVFIIHVHMTVRLNADFKQKRRCISVKFCKIYLKSIKTLLTSIDNYAWRQH